MHLQNVGKQPAPESPLLLASPVDFEHGGERLKRVERMLSGEEPVTRRYKALVEGVVQVRALGGSAHALCLTQYVKSGRRREQLTIDQEDALQWAIKLYRTEPLVRTRTQAHDHLVILCEEKGIRAPSETTLNRRINGKNPAIRAYTVGGNRGYHAEEQISDPQDRTLRSFIPGLMVHVDSTKFDERCTPEFLSSLGFDCPTLYAAVDSASGNTLGRAILFGPSCRNALAVLIRDVLHRQGYLPRYWIADGGSEYTGPWFEGFCAMTGVTRIQPPPGAPRKNSLAENALGRINAELAHRFLGSTAPDKQGRSVTSRQKSYATACHNYATVVDHLDKYLFQDMSEVPHGVSRGTGEEKYELMKELFGHVGTISVTNMDDFLIATSVPIDRDTYIGVMPTSFTAPSMTSYPCTSTNFALLFPPR